MILHELSFKIWQLPMQKKRDSCSLSTRVLNAILRKLYNQTSLAEKKQIAMKKVKIKLKSTKVLFCIKILKFLSLYNIQIAQEPITVHIFC